MGLFSLISGIIGGGGQKKASKQAAQLQYDAAIKGIAETGRQFDVTQANYAPYQAFGKAGLDHFSDLAGLNGYEPQDREISLLRDSPLYQSLYRNGEDAILATASATGGLRGGNTEHSLADFGVDTLAKVIQQQLGTYGGAIGVGQNATGAVAGYGAQATADMNQQRDQGAAYKAGDILTRAGITAKGWQNAGGFLDNAISAVPGIGGFLSKIF